MTYTRRTMLRTGVSTLAGAMAASALGAAPGAGEVARPATTRDRGPAPFRERSCYITFMRGTTFGIEAWKQIFDAVHADGGNLILLWMGGAFASRKFPITWQNNAEHQNVQHNFAGELIDYAHALSMRVLLCLTPFGYDGVNQYALEHPELTALDKHGNYTAAFGLGAWEYNLNPYLAKSQDFMLEYTRELLEFYPNADGLMLESSDYAISYCEACPQSYYQAEFQFVRQISSEVWARKPDALIVVYPHYFAGSEVPGMQVQGAREASDSRWGLFFTPHSAPVDDALIKQARSVLYWDSSPTFGNPNRIRDAARKASAAGATGFVPSFEPWTYVLQGPDGGDQFLLGQRLAPFGFGWLQQGASPAKELLMRVNRVAYRVYSSHPAAPDTDFRRALSQELFHGEAAEQLLDDLLFVNESFFLDRTWVSVSAVASADYVKGLLTLGRISPAQLEDYRGRRARLALVAKRYAKAGDAPTRELCRTATWMVDEWQRVPAHAWVDAHLG